MAADRSKSRKRKTQGAVASKGGNAIAKNKSPSPGPKKPFTGKDIKKQGGKEKKEKKEKKGRKDKKGKKGKKKKKKKGPRCPIKRRKKALKRKCYSLTDHHALLNAYYTMHGVIEMLKFRKFKWKKKKA